MNDVFFDRTVEIRFGIPGEVGKKFTDLRVGYDIEKTSTSEPNKAKVSVYNLTKDSRSLAERKGIRLEVFAGYGGKNELIFQGDVARVISRRDGSNVVTEFEAGDGEKAYSETVVNKSFSPGVSFASVMDTVAATFGLPVKTKQGVQTESYSNGLSISGSSKDVLDELTQKQGLIWSIQDGAIQILKPGEGTGEESVLLSANTGLIGSPKKKDKGIEVTSLLNPKIKPDRPVFLQSKFMSAVIVPQKVKHVGDSQSGDWFTIIEAEFK